MNKNKCWLGCGEKETLHKTTTFASLTTPTKAFDCVDHSKLENSERGIQDDLTCLVPEETCMQHKKQQLELDMEQQTGSKLRKKYDKAIYCHPAYLNFTQRTSCEMPGWMIHKLESRLPGEISVMSDMQMTSPYGRK